MFQPPSKIVLARHWSVARGKGNVRQTLWCDGQRHWWEFETDRYGEGRRTEKRDVGECPRYRGDFCV